MTELEKLHAADLDSISNQLKEFYAQKKKVRIYHGSTNSTRPQKYKKGEIVDISQLKRIISIDREKKYALVEPNVPMDALVEKTLKFGLVPPVVMELPGITVGGGIQGGAGESSSFKYGLFHDTCLEYEIVLGNGDVIQTSREKNSDLFWGTACSYGSLGVITLVKINLICSKKFVHLAYHRVGSFSEAISTIKKNAAKSVDYIDGIMFSKNLGVIMIGNLEDTSKNLPVSTFLNAADEWFYLHAEDKIKKFTKYEEVIPIKDYLFRYDRGGFWTGWYGFNIFKMPFNRFTRFIFNPLFKARNLYRYIHTTNSSQEVFMQDISFPRETVTQFIEFVSYFLHIHPLWLCPLKPGENDKLSPAFSSADLVIDVGIWGPIDKSKDFIEINREIEKITKKFGGRKVLYAHQYYTPEEFWKIYDLKWYNGLRKKYHAENVFHDVYEKTRVSGTYKRSIPKGLLSVIKSPFKLPVS
ncbi:MAG: FAD-binding protein [Candidatus Liptonbacteria bacterium]|nr:FAD-binding protein [Candidatus Liptonbacteria bacterium]